DKVIREKGHEWMQENPIGTGPYKLVRWAKKQEHLLVRNDDYWGPKPAFKYVRVRIIPEQATQIAELISGGVDVIKAVPPDQMDVIDKSGAARTSTSPILRTALLQLAQAGRTGPNPFTDRRVRTAANLAKAGIRRRRRYVGEVGPFVNLVRDGKGEPMFEWSWGYYSVFDADAILYDVMKCGEQYSYYCNKALDDLIIQGRSTLDQKK